MKDKSSKTLCVVVVIYRVLKMNREDSILAMQELQRRETTGDDFDYKAFIDEEIKKIQEGLPPAPNLNSMNLIQGFMKGVKS